MTLDMSLDEAEFRRIHGRLADGEMTRTISERHPCHWHLHPCRVEISLRPLEPRRTGALALPRMAVTLDMSSLPDATARTAFLHRFRTVFQRGGG